jgi:putative sterol carrier protein
MTEKETVALPRAPQLDRLDPDIRNHDATYRFDLGDDRSILLSLEQGRLAARDGGSDAACVIACSPDNFRRFMNGELNLLTAFLRGDASIRGDLAAAKRLYRYLRFANTKENQT